MVTLFTIFTPLAALGFPISPAFSVSPRPQHLPVPFPSLIGPPRLKEQYFLVIMNMKHCLVLRVRVSIAPLPWRAPHHTAACCLIRPLSCSRILVPLSLNPPTRHIPQTPPLLRQLLLGFIAPIHPPRNNAQRISCTVSTPATPISSARSCGGE